MITAYFVPFLIMAVSTNVHIFAIVMHIFNLIDPFILQSTKADRICPQGNIPMHTELPIMPQCIASCLNLIEPTEVKQKPCYYNKTSGKCAYFLTIKKIVSEL